MSKERLKNIDENKELNVCGITGKPLSVELSIKEYSYLYTQAERVQELEKDVSEWKIVNEQWEKINTSLVEQNKRYREAILLAYYELGFALDETEIGETKERILQAKLILRNANVLEEMK